MPNVPPTADVQLTAIGGLPEIRPGDDLGVLLAERLRMLEPPLGRFDVVVLAQKIVSKAENRFVALDSVTPSDAGARAGGRDRQGSATPRGDPGRDHRGAARASRRDRRPPPTGVS